MERLLQVGSQISGACLTHVTNFRKPLRLLLQIQSLCGVSLTKCPREDSSLPVLLSLIPKKRQRLLRTWPKLRRSNEQRRKKPASALLPRLRSNKVITGAFKFFFSAAPDASVTGMAHMILREQPSIQFVRSENVTEVANARSCEPKTSVNNEEYLRTEYYKNFHKGHYDLKHFYAAAKK